MQGGWGRTGLEAEAWPWCNLCKEGAKSTGAVSAQGQGRRPNPEMMASIWVVSESNLGWEEVWILAPAPTFYSQSLLLHPCWILWPLPTKFQLHGAGHLGAHLEGANRAGTYTLMLKAPDLTQP